MIIFLLEYYIVIKNDSYEDFNNMVEMFGM